MYLGRAVYIIRGELDEKSFYGKLRLNLTMRNPYVAVIAHCEPSVVNFALWMDRHKLEMNERRVV